MKKRLVNILLAFTLNFVKGHPKKSEIHKICESIRNGLGTSEPFSTAVVRLGFHDCVGGCDGCLNFEDVNNNGLQPITQLLEDIYWQNGFDALLSHADYWAMATTIGVQDAMKKALGICQSNCGPLPCIPYYFGRKECSNAPLR